MPVSALALAQLNVRRRNFVGRTDKYASPRGPASQVVETVQKELGFLDFVADNGVFNEFYRETAIERLARYKRLMRFYEGKQFESDYDDGEKKVVFNFCKAISDKAVDFFISKGFKSTSQKGHDDVAQVIDMIWDANNRSTVLRKLALPQSICGDGFLYVTVQTKDEAGNDIPESEWKVKLIPLDPFFVFPVFSKSEEGELSACLIQFPEEKNEAGEVTFHTLYITPDKFIEKKGDQTISEGTNPFGRVNVVHFPNYEDPTSAYGQSDIVSVVPLNEEYNATANAIRRIIRYHAEPTTVIFGAKASKLEKGAKKVWSGLPTDARVENLAFTADLKSTYDYLGNIEEQIYKVASIPGVLFKPDRAMSHTSGAALKMTYEPLLELTDRKVQAFTAAARRVNRLILLALDFLGMEGAPALGEIEEIIRDIKPSFPDPLPYDETAQLDLDIKKLNSGVISLSDFIKKYNPDADMEKLTAALVADAFYRIAAKREEAVALQGGQPAIEAFLLSSVAVEFLTEADIEKIKKLKPKPVEPPAATATPPSPKG